MINPAPSIATISIGLPKGPTWTNDRAHSVDRKEQVRRWYLPTLDRCDHNRRDQLVYAARQDESCDPGSGRRTQRSPHSSA
jgi:hypothetical protein